MKADTFSFKGHKIKGLRGYSRTRGGGGGDKVVLVVAISRSDETIMLLFSSGLREIGFRYRRGKVQPEAPAFYVQIRRTRRRRDLPTDDEARDCPFACYTVKKSCVSVC